MKLCLYAGDCCSWHLSQGFKYFATHLRGREEMVCSVINEPMVMGGACGHGFVYL